MKAKRFQLIELIKPATQVAAGSRLYFQDQPQLKSFDNQKVTVLALEVFDSAVMPVSPSGNNVATSAQNANAVLVINCGGAEDLQFIPMLRLMPVQGTGVAVAAPYLLFEVANLVNVDWTKSYIQFCGAAPAAQISFMIGVHYLKNGN